ASAWADLKHGNYPVFEGYGRIDAVQRIANTVFGHGVSPSNFRAATAPVNYPFLWDIGKFNWVQYEGYASQPMARNINESLGTGARLDAFDEHGAPLPMHLRYGTSVQPDKLHAIERTIDKELPSLPRAAHGSGGRRPDRAAGRERRRPAAFPHARRLFRAGFVRRCGRVPGQGHLSTGRDLRADGGRRVATGRRTHGSAADA
ncbi:MAG: hypothetical protein H6R02_3078, partial [Burkholderiaceae bacterium]|nr:hypothetical protein [Burkholderiaceae bacterium]